MLHRYLWFRPSAFPPFFFHSPTFPPFPPILPPFSQIVPRITPHPPHFHFPHFFKAKRLVGQLGYD